MLEKGDEPVPGYHLEAFLGRGQFGEVWRANSPGGVKVALKFLNLNEHQGLKEFRAIQQIKTIRYPHLASVTALWLLGDEGEVLDDAVGSRVAPSPSQRDTLIPSSTVKSDRPPQRLIVATLLCDKSLSDRLAECQAQGLDGIPVDELLRYMEETAKGIDFLNSQRHDLGEGPIAIQHCDIKPANIMLTGDSVMICDFGVATFLSNPRIAATGTSMAGSPAYMSPECAECKPSVASDQYSLAITYVELRTGELPFQCNSWIEVIEAHRSGKLDLAGLTPGEQDVIRKATSVNPEDRYPSAVAMARALRQAVEPADQAAPAAKPRRTLAKVAVGLSLLALLVWGVVQFVLTGDNGEPHPGGGGSAQLDVTASFLVEPANAEVVVDGQAVEPDAEGRVSLTRPRGAQVEVEVRKPPEYRETREQFAVVDLIGQAQVIRLDRDTEYLRQLAETHAGEAFEIVSKDEEHLPNLDEAVEKYREALRLDQPRYAVVPLFVRSLHEAAEKEYDLTIRCMAIHPNKTWLVARLKGTKIALWNLDNLDVPPRVLHEHESDVSNVVMTGQYVASADWAGKIKLSLLDENGQPKETQEPGDLSGPELAITPDEHWLIAGDYDGNVCGWKLDGADHSPVPIGRHGETVRAVVITSDSGWAITAGEDGTVSKWNLQTPDPAAGDAKLGAQPRAVSSLVMSPCERWVAFGGEAQSDNDFLISRIDLIENRMQAFAKGHTREISALAYDQFVRLRPDQGGPALLASGSADGQIQIYKGDPPKLYSAHAAAIRSLTFCPASGWLVSGSDDKRVGLWDLQDPEKEPLMLDGKAGRVVQVLVTPKWLIAGYYNGAILLWDLRRCILVKRAADEQEIELHDASGGVGTIET